MRSTPSTISTTPTLAIHSATATASSPKPGATARYTFDGDHLRSLFGKIAYQRNDASGINWSYSGVALSGGGDIHLHGPFDARLSGSWASRNYAGDFSSQGYDRETQQTLTLGGQLMWAIAPAATADIGIRYRAVTGNDTDLDEHDTRVTAGLTIRLK